MYSQASVLKGRISKLGLADASYPPSLKASSVRPDALYAMGDLDVLSLPMLAIVGSRRATQYGVSCARLLTRAAVQAGFVVATSCSLGVGAAAAESALMLGGRVAVFAGGGLAAPFYPAASAALAQRAVDGGGVVVSAEHPYVEPTPHGLRRRLALMALSCRAVLVCEASLPSGILDMAERALSEGRPVLAVPGRIDSVQSRGCNALIEDGATAVTGEEGLAELLDGLR